MFRRCISLLVIVGFLASQLAAVPHAHAGISTEERQKHDATPHVHVSWLSHDRDGHEHSHGGHRHEHGQPEKQPTDKLLLHGIADSGHDADAAYVPAQASAVVAGKQQDLPMASLVLAANVDCQGLVAGIESGGGRGSYWHPPDAVLDGSDTYLTLRNLRI